jgi:hypothetical protein
MLDKEILVENIQVFFPVSLRDDEVMFCIATEEILWKEGALVCRFLAK